MCECNIELDLALKNSSETIQMTEDFPAPSGFADVRNQVRKNGI